MKLIAKTSLYYLLLSIPILILSGVVGYYVIAREVNTSNDELLLSRKVQIEKYIKNNDSIDLLLISKSNEAKIEKVSFSNFKDGSTIQYSDTIILNSVENEMEVNRMLTSIIKVKDENYQIKIWRSTLEFDELIEGIFYLLAVILFFLFLISVLINIWVSKTLWLPFYKTIQNLKSFRASQNEIPNFKKTSITEFEVLNNSLHQMMDKMITDYNSQKKFTENASHEIQTPLAVIKSKIDLLIQSENLKEQDVDLIASIDDACSKLSRLNKSLLLLTKIENRQFKNTDEISITKIIDQSLLLFEEQINASSINVLKEVQSDFLININPDLGLILINNLIQNGIRHNREAGFLIYQNLKGLSFHSEFRK